MSKHSASLSEPACRRFCLRRARGLPGPASGQSLVEFVLVVPILMLLVFGIIEFGRYFYTRLTLRDAVAEAARYAVTGNQFTDPVTGDPIGRATSIERIIEQRTSSLGVDPADISISPADGGAPEQVVTINVHYHYAIALPSIASIVPTSLLDFTVSTSMRNEPFY
jgi:hypothetical protein